jgi:hypothetical protein
MDNAAWQRSVVRRWSAGGLDHEVGTPPPAPAACAGRLRHRLRRRLHHRLRLRLRLRRLGHGLATASGADPTRATDSKDCPGRLPP